MSRTFASGQFINHGSAASLDTLPVSVGAMTAWGWVYRTANGANQHVITKDTTPFGSGTEFSLFVENGFGGEGAVRFLVARATTHTDYATVAGMVPLNRWTFVCAVFDEAATPRVRFYVAPRSAAPTEPSLSVSDYGSGAISATAGTANLYIGNLQRADTYPFLGRIGRGGVIARALTGAEVATLHTLSLATDIAGSNVTDTRLLFDYAVDLQDYSGNGNHGTATGTAAAAVLPALGSPNAFFTSTTSLFSTAYGAMAWDAVTERLHMFGVSGTTVNHHYSDNEGSTWSSATAIRTFAEVPLYRSAEANDGTVFVLVREQYDTGCYLYRSLDNGATWETPVILGGLTASIEDRLTLSVDGASVHILWGKAGVPSDATFKLNYWRSTDSGASFVNGGNPVVIVDWASEEAGAGPSPGGVKAEGGVVHVGYAHANPAVGSLPHRARYIRSTDGGATWGSSVNISGSAEDKPQIRPRAATKDGRVLVFWEEGLDHDQGAAYPNATRAEVRGILSTDNGATWGAAFNLTGYGQDYLGHPEAHFGPGHAFHLSWMVGPSQVDQENVAGTANYRLWTQYGTVAGSHEVVDDRPTVYSVANIWRSQNYVHVFGSGIYSRRAIVEDVSVGVNWYFLDTATGGWGELQLGGTPPADATGATGWDVTGLAAGQHARMAFGTVRLPGDFSGTAQPSSGPDDTLKDCFRRATPLSGTIPAGNHTVRLPAIASAAGTEGANVRARVRIWRSVNADGSTPTEITSGAVAGTSVSTLQSEAEQVSTVNLGTLGAVTLTNEYVFVQVACETV